MFITLKNSSEEISSELLHISSSLNSSTSSHLRLEILATYKLLQYLDKCYTKNNRRIDEIEVLENGKITKYRSAIILSDLHYERNTSGKFIFWFDCLVN